MREVLRVVRRFYGANPLHLLTLLACFSLAGYVVTQFEHDPSLLRIVVWFAGAVVAHDLVAFPLYALADRSLHTALSRRHRPTPLLLNHVRVPALASGLLFAIFFPGIIQQGAGAYRAATGQNQHPFLARWLLLTAALFAISAVAYAFRVARRRGEPSGDGETRRHPKG